MTVGSIALIAAAGVGGYIIFKPAQQSASPSIATHTMSSPSTASNSSSTSSSSSQDTSTSSATSAAAYKDGTYTAQATYRVPHGDENTISATIVVSGGNITSVKTNDNYSSGESGAYINSFESEVNSDASGQSLASYSPSRIGGASLTTEGFLSVLDTVRNDAKA